MLTKLRELLPDSIEKKFNLKSRVENNKLIIDIDFYLYKYDLYGKTFKLSLINECNVKVDDPVNWKNVLFEKEYIIDGHKKQITIDLNEYNMYSYRWIYIDTRIKALIHIDDKIFFDTKKNIEIKNILVEKSPDITWSKSLMERRDKFKIIENFNALSYNWKLFFLIILFIIIIFFIINYTYLILLIFIVPLMYIVLKKYFKNYMTFELLNYNFSSDDIDKEYKLSDIVIWKSNVDLKNIWILIVASNIEKWQNIKWSWRSRHTYNFNEQVNWIILYQEVIDFIPKNTDISEYIKWSFSFKNMYERLYPPLYITDNHWIDVAWKIQLIHNDFIDQEVRWPVDFMKYENFFKYK